MEENEIACRHAIKVWDEYHARLKDIPIDQVGKRWREWAVDSKPWFLAAEFIKAADDLRKEQLITPADANIIDDVKCFPPIPKAILKVRGRPKVNRYQGGRGRGRGVNRNQSCTNCGRDGHNISRCNVNTIWFDRGVPGDANFRAFHDASLVHLPRPE